MEGAGSAADRDFDRASRWAAIVESSADAIIGWSPDGAITSWNAGAERMYGYAADEIVGHSMSVLIPPDRASGLPDLMDRLRRGENVTFLESTAVR